MVLKPELEKAKKVMSGKQIASVCLTVCNMSCLLTRLEGGKEDDPD
jgi:hypothetical protein